MHGQIENKKIILMIHIGLGDQLICNGMVHHYLSFYEEVYLPYKKFDEASVRFLYRNYPRVNLFEATEAETQDEVLAQFLSRQWQADYLMVGRIEGNKKAKIVECDIGHDFDSSFYWRANIPFRLKWENFKLERDKLNSEMFAPEGDYVFCHDDPARGYRISKWSLPEGVRQISPDPTQSGTIFDYLSVIENAKEIHVIDSSFLHLIDLTSLGPEKHLYYHKYARPVQATFTAKRHWHVVLSPSDLR